MKLLFLESYTFRSLCLIIATTSILLLTWVTALTSSQIAYDEMRRSLLQQSIQLIQKLAEDSVVPLLYDSRSNAIHLVAELVETNQVAYAGIFDMSGKPLVDKSNPFYQPLTYPIATSSAPFKSNETDQHWVFTALIISQPEPESSSEQLFLGGDDDDEGQALGFIRVAVSKKIIYQSQQEIFSRILMVSVAIGLFFLVIIYYILKKITRPLEELAGLMKLARDGHYEKPKTISATKEIKHMFTAFNAMLVAIKEREQNLSLTLDSIGDAVIVTDGLGNVIRMNPVAEQLTGQTLPKARGLPLKSIFTIIDASTRAPIENPVDKVLATGETVYLSNHTTLVSASGREYQIADSAAPIRDDDNQVVGMVVVFNDVTEQYRLREVAAKNERDLNSIMEHSTAIIYVKNTEGFYTYVNKRFEDTFNLTLQQMLSKTDHDIFPKEQADGFRNNDLIVQKGGTLKYEAVLDHGETVKTYMTVKFPLKDGSGKIYAVCGISTDISDRKVAEESLRRTQKMDAIGQLSGGIAHDFNNQLGVVIGYLDFLKDFSEKDEKASRWVDTATRATLRCMDLTRQLLAFSRKREPNNKIVNINNSLNELKNMISRSVTPAIDVEYSLATDLCLVDIDPGEFQDVLLNLSINARDAMPNGGKLLFETQNKQLSDLQLTAYPNIHSNNCVQISVTDTGTGIEKDTLERIFEPFFTTKEEGKGTGLGLAMVYGFAKRYKGHITAYSEVNIGTTFRILLPCSQQTGSEVQSTVEQKTELPTGNETILVVDDEENLLELAIQYLNQLGYKTLKASNGQDATSLLNEPQKIDCLFSDVVMPGGMNGYELAKYAKVVAPTIKVLLTSGFTSKANKTNGLEELDRDLLNKPYRIEELAVKIRQVLDGQAT